MKNTAQQVPAIRAECTQLGLHVEATMNGTDWVTVQLTPYKTRNSVSVRQYSTCIDPALDRAEYFQTLRNRGIQFTEMR